MPPRLTRDEAWRLTGVVLLVAAFLLRSAPLALLGAGLVVAALSVDLWGRFALRGVAYRRQLGERRAFFGEEVPFLVEIDNRKLLPLPWLEADDSLPAGLDLVERPVVPEPGTGRALLRQVVSLRWYERVRLRYRLRCRVRGAFTLGPVRLSSGDPFGFAARETQLETLDRILVYPMVLPLEALGLPSRHPFGEAGDRRRLFPDPTRLAGVRPYVAGDSPRHVHWKASARLQALQTRVFEPTTSHTLMLYVNLASFEGFWWAALNRELLELAIVSAASVASWALEQDYHVGLATNGAAVGGRDEVGLVPAGGPQQRVRILEALARVSRFARTPLEGMLARDRTRLPWGTTVVVVTAVVPEGVQRALLALLGAGHVPVVLRVGAPATAPREPDGGSGWLTYHVPDTIPWADLPALPLGRPPPT
jgi:uncharacterized protein (DUF58 family)